MKTIVSSRKAPQVKSNKFMANTERRKLSEFPEHMTLNFFYKLQNMLILGAVKNNSHNIGCMSFTSCIGMTDFRKVISSSLSLKLAIKWMHSSRPAKTVYSPPKGFFLKYRSNL